MNPPDDLNEELMRNIGTRLRDQRFIKQVNKFPLEKPDRIVVTFHKDIYPAPVSDAWLELRLRLNDDLNIVYIEEWSDSHWACRWDRHNETTTITTPANTFIRHRESLRTPLWISISLQTPIV